MKMCKPSANCACAIPLTDGLGYQYAFLPLVARRESGTGLATVVDSVRESIHALCCDLFCLQDTLVRHRVSDVVKVAVMVSRAVHFERTYTHAHS